VLQPEKVVPEPMLQPEKVVLELVLQLELVVLSGLRGPFLFFEEHT
jgi:hypothetical protein